MHTALGMWVVGCAFALLAVPTGPALRADPTAATVVLRQSSVNGGGRVSGSTSFQLTGTLAGEPASGASASPAFLLQSGFWAFLGPVPVPIVLHVSLSDSVSQKCDLQWSGNSAPYEVFVADNCANVFDDLYATSSQNSLFGVTTLSSGLTCFNVVSMTSPSQVRP